MNSFPPRFCSAFNLNKIIIISIWKNRLPAVKLTNQTINNGKFSECFFYLYLYLLHTIWSTSNCICSKSTESMRIRSNRAQTAMKWLKTYVALDFVNASEKVSNTSWPPVNDNSPIVTKTIWHLQHHNTFVFGISNAIPKRVNHSSTCLTKYAERIKILIYCNWASEK